jgi:hypothetical protein
MRGHSIPHFLDPSGMAEGLSHWSYLGIFLCLFLGNLGIPVPEELFYLPQGSSPTTLSKIGQALRRCDSGRHRRGRQVTLVRRCYEQNAPFRTVGDPS